MRNPFRFPPLVVLLGLLGAACGSDGEAPPIGRLYYPIAITMSPDSDGDGDADYLLVANSNFDLRYRSGSLQAYQLDVLAEQIRLQCGGRDPGARAGCGIIPVEDQRDDLTDDIVAVTGLLRSEVLIGSFADGLTAAPSAGGTRLYLPVRSDGDLTHVDLAADGTLRCGDDESSTDFSARHECDDHHRSAEDGVARADGLDVPPDPVGVSVGPRPGGDGNFIVMAHRGGRFSLMWEPIAGARPELVDVIGGYPNELIDVQADPQTGVLWVPTAFDTVVPRLAVALGDRREDSFLFRVSDLRVANVDFARNVADTRSVRFDPRPGVRRAYVLSRIRPALWIVDVDDSVGALDVREVIRVGSGASRLEVAHFPDQDDAAGEGRTLAFTTSFDERELSVIDVDAAQPVGIVRSLGGAFDLSVDVARRLVYVTDFRSSVIRVIDLQPMFDCLDSADPVAGECSPQTVGFVGRPRAIQELI